MQIDGGFALGVAVALIIKRMSASIEKAGIEGFAFRIKVRHLSEIKQILEIFLSFSHSQSRGKIIIMCKESNWALMSGGQAGKTDA
jgi:hypothetical protein